jgi:predicted nucleic acid-binding protein
VKVFVDTGAFCAATIPADERNSAAKDTFRSLHQQKALLFTSDYVLAELFTLLNVRAGHRAAVTFMDTFEKSGISVLRVSETIEIQAKNIFRRMDIPRLSFTDCTSFALINGHRLDHAFSFDGHFRIFRFSHPVIVLGQP